MSRSRSSSTPLVVQRGSVGAAAIEALDDLLLRRVEPGAPADGVNGFESAGRHQPRPRPFRNALPRPLLDRRGEGVVERLLGEVEVAEEADQRREHAARLGPVDGVHRLADPVRRVRIHWGLGISGAPASQMGRTSTLPHCTPGIREATWMASLRSLASMR